MTPLTHHEDRIRRAKGVVCRAESPHTITSKQQVELANNKGKKDDREKEGVG
jgi:hypothetical protein